MTEDVTLVVVLDPAVLFLGCDNLDRALHSAHQRVLSLDAAVEQADPNTGPGGAAEGPLAGDLEGPARGQRGGLRAGPQYVGGGRLSGGGHPPILLRQPHPAERRS